MLEYRIGSTRICIRVGHIYFTQKLFAEFSDPLPHVCAPDIDVDYVINPWMEGNIHKSSRDHKSKQ